MDERIAAGQLFTRPGVPPLTNQLRRRMGNSRETRAGSRAWAALRFPAGRRAYARRRGAETGLQTAVFQPRSGYESEESGEREGETAFTLPRDPSRGTLGRKFFIRPTLSPGSGPPCSSLYSITVV